MQVMQPFTTDSFLKVQLLRLAFPSGVIHGVQEGPPCGLADCRHEFPLCSESRRSPMPAKGHYS
jgi:hypothetical protein